ncbi:MAG: cation:proton antiporter, partial [Gammaproteobacteria bacterium]|nr:cation:proton antiporter [Gammaproteobacteria bacterium]
MTELFGNILATAGGQDQFNAVLIVGAAIFCGTVGARIFQRLHIPQVVGYVVMGIIIGQPVLGLINGRAISALEPLNLFALGMIGFLVGGELKRQIFVKFGRQVMSILLFEGVAAFLLVGLSSFAVTWYFTDIRTAVAVGVVLGAICTATDPASTTQVLWEYKTRGAVTTMLIAIIALDDALALVLYAIAISVASVFTGTGEVSFVAAMAISLGEIFGSLCLGVG